MTLQEQLFSLRDENYAAFSAKLIPTVPADRFIGVRSPQLRALAKELSKNSNNQTITQSCLAPRETRPATAVEQSILGELPHRYHEENMLHAYLLCIARDYATVVEETERFLPYIDNWAVCDSLAPRTFARHKADLLPRIRKWMASEHEYTVRFGIGTLMRHFLDDNFRAERGVLHPYDAGLVLRHRPRQAVGRHTPPPQLPQRPPPLGPPKIHPEGPRELPRQRRPQSNPQNITLINS